VRVDSVGLSHDGEAALSAIGVGFLKVRAGHLVAVVLLVYR
jgi:hypothetical protein